MPLNGRLIAAAQFDYTSALDLATANTPLNMTSSLALTNGIGASQSDKIFHDTRTLAPSANEDLDLAGVLLDAYGAALAFARVKGLIVRATAANTNNVIVGNATSNGFVSWVGGAVHTVTVRPGGLLALFAPDAVAYIVTAATADLLRVANSAGGTPVTYDIVIVGASA